MKPLHLKPKHLLYSMIGFTIGYFFSGFITNYGINQYLAGLAGNLIGFLIIYYILE